MSYQVIARKWRPQLFEEVVGQGHITTTLRNAVKLGRVGHAYLFAGPRGVGKTTTARLLAKSLNCVQGPTPDPCNECEHCRGIAGGSDVDVIEIDAASNRGIDEIRALRENVKFAPAASRYKVYIIDEVHMLTREAFNALLKTLEEPPSHALFILATTDPDKLPPTILSRCQQLTFRRVPAEATAELLRSIAGAEGYELEEEASLMLARSAGGSIRDAESALEQLFAFTEGRIGVEEARSVLGKVDREQLGALTTEIVEGDAAGLVARLGGVIDSGVDPRVVAEELLAFWRDCFLTALGGAAAAEAEVAEAGTAALSPPEAWLARLAVLRRGLGELKLTRQPRLVLELLLVELARMRDLIPVAELAARLAEGRGLDDEKKKPEPPELTAGPLVDAPREKPAPTWAGFLDELRSRDAAVAAFCAEAERIEEDGSILRLCFAADKQFHQQSLLKAENRGVFEKVAKSYFGSGRTLEALLDYSIGTGPSPGQSPGQSPGRAPEPPAAASTGELDGLNAHEREAVTMIINSFNGRLVLLKKE